MLDLIAFDADDTLWYNESRYVEAKDRLKRLLSAWDCPERVERKLDETEVSNIPSYGYGIKSFTLSMIETAVQVTDGQIGGKGIEEIMAIGRQMLAAEVHVFENVEETLARLARDYPLMLITKGDLFEQQCKVERSGLMRCFSHVEIVSEKTEAMYRGLLARHHVEPHRFMMVGNSMRSDILPVLRIGARAVYIPHEHTWSYERQVGDQTPPGEYFELQNLGELPELVERISKL